jgi:NadR type nicotinamide-nucleotide adenylyltransferase
VKARHGLVIGKFYPPHAGHHHLIRAAAAESERVTVVVMASSVESLSLPDRVRWLQEVHAGGNVIVTGIGDDHPVDYDDDALWRVHVALMLEAAGAVTDEPIDAVFTSEAYGAELGRRLGARHVAVDPARGTYRVSGTVVRADPARYWELLAPPVRAELAWRVVIVGAESTGKTTLAAALAEALRARGGPFASTAWVGEVGRDVTEAKLAALGPGAPMGSLVWTSADFVAIAREQARRERAAAAAGGPVLLCDTDAFVTGVWHERYLGARARVVESLGAAAPYHLYLLTHHDDVPFVQDGLRDGEHVREWMTGVFVARLHESRRRWQWLRGGREERLARALGAIDELLAAGWGFAAPLG